MSMELNSMDYADSMELSSYVSMESLSSTGVRAL
jgi:hypothetical protein